MQLEWESGLETINSGLYTTTYPNLVLHCGISNNLEINAEATWLTATDKTQTNNIHTTGLEPVLIGANYLLVEETPKSPAVITYLQLAIPFMSSSNFRTNYTAPVFEVSVWQPFSSKFSAGCTPGIFWDGFSSVPVYTYNLSIDYRPNEKWEFNPEIFGFITNTEPQHNFDAEIDYNFSRKLQLGIIAGIGLSPAAHKSYFAISGTYGFTLHKNKKVPQGNLSLSSFILNRS